MENYKNTINTKFLNYLSDSILMVLGSESIIVSTIIDESLIIDGFTESNVLPSNNELKNIVNSKDPEGKTPLFYACYFNF